jgi:hypothetical protein
VVSALDGRCVEGMLGPGRSSVATSACAGQGQQNVKQRWSFLADGTVRASNNRTLQCLTAEAGLATATATAGSGSGSDESEPGATVSAATVDVFAGALAGGDAVVVFFNRGGAAAEGTLPLLSLPGWEGGGFTGATVRDVWAMAPAPQPLVAGQVHSGSVEPHGAVFLRLTQKA